MPGPLSLPRLAPSGARRPEVGMVHLGLGAFFRAHGAVYIAEALAASGGNWGILGVSLQSAETRDRLRPQDFVYTAAEMGESGETYQRIEIIRDVLVAREDPAAVLARMAAAEVKIVSLTVTEKGYCHHPASGALNWDHPDIVHDLASELPVSAPGFLVRALAARFHAGLAPFTVMSCDNLPSNGEVVRGAVLDFARALDPALAEWIAEKGAFPSSMVDRIVPAVTEEGRARLAASQGFYDAAPVFHEPFRQWVIEERFVEEARPDFAAAGVQMAEDVTAFEHMKLRMLNGSHSALAYLGYLAGRETIADCVRDPGLYGFITRLWREEIIPTLVPPPGEDLEVYAETLTARYRNPAIRHLTKQIASDGSQKIPQRLLGSVADNFAANRSCPGLILALAAWMRFTGGVDEQGNSFAVADPMAERLRALHAGASDDAELVSSFLSLREIFPGELAKELALPLTKTYQRLCKVGAARAAAEFSA